VRAAAELERVAGIIGRGPAIFGGDMNVRPFQAPALFEQLGPVPGPKAIDHLFAVGLEVEEPPHALAPERRELPAEGGRLLRLSDHAPVAAAFRVE
jgi:endonuclease/exonuclease/phosphatase (EEP) superfamily protein YafD